MRLLMSIGLCAAVAVSAAPAFGADQYRVRQAEIVDPSGFASPMVASRVFIPFDWQARGGVAWNPGSACTGDVVRVQWEASDPSGLYGLDVMPAVQWEANSTQSPGACPFLLFQNAQDYLHGLVGYYRSGAQVIDYRLRTDLMEGQPGDLAAGAYGPRTIGEIGEILIAYTMSGQDMREIIRAKVTVSTNVMSDGLTTMGFLNGYAEPAIAMRAPNGALDFRLFDFITKSISIDPQWQGLVAEKFGAVGKVVQQEQQRRAEEWRRANADIGALIADGYWSSQEAIARQAQSWSESTLGVEHYNDPRTGELIQLPNTYPNAWRMVDGSYVIAADPSFDPNVAFGVEAYQLQLAP